MRKFVIGLILVGFILAFISQASAMGNPDTYIVQRGDTLSGIAEKVFGDYKKWRELADINGLKVTDIVIRGKKYSHVLIVPGQILKLKLYRDMTLSESIDILNDLLMQRVKMFGHPQYANTEDALSAFKNYQEELYHTTLSEVYELKRNLHKLMSEMKIAYEDYCMLVVAEKLISATLLSLPPDSYLEPEKAVTRVLQIMALLEIESGYRNVRGKHGEIGWYQVKPTTWVYYSNLLAESFYPDIEPLFEGTSDVMEEDFFLATVWSAWLMRYLIETEGDYFRAMKRYNNGSEREAYATKVDRRFLHLHALFYKRWHEQAEVR